MNVKRSAMGKPVFIHIHNIVVTLSIENVQLQIFSHPQVKVKLQQISQRHLIVLGGPCGHCKEPKKLEGHQHPCFT